MTVDFAKLYAQLGIQADCSLEEFKRSCRRRIREQHPDRLPPHADEDIPLAEWLPLYASALRFHRKHGRLPGAPQAPAPTIRPNAAREPLRPLPARPAAPLPAPTRRGGKKTRTAARGKPQRRDLLLIAAAVATALALLYACNGAPSAPLHDEAQEAPAAPDAEAAEPADAQKKPDRLEIGMKADEVHRIQGSPLQQNGSEWTYGPSWLRFERGRLVDWYSSPLHPLQTATRTPYSDPP